MSMDPSGRRAARVAKFVVDLTWWLGLGVSIAFVAVFLAAPVLERAGVVATFAWTGFGINSEIDGGHGLPRTVVRVAVADSSAAVAPALAMSDSMRAADVKLTVDQSSRLEVTTRRWGFFYAANAMSVVIAFATLVMVYILRAFLAAVIAGDVFTATNARRMSTLGWLLVAVGVAAPHMERLRAQMVLSYIQPMGAALSPADTDSDGRWLLGVLILVIAAAWRYGSELQLERDLTV